MKNMTALTMIFLFILITLSGCSGNPNQITQWEENQNVDTKIDNLQIKNVSIDEEIYHEEIPPVWITPVDFIDVEGMYLHSQLDNLNFTIDEDARVSLYVNIVPIRMVSRYGEVTYTSRPGSNRTLVMKTSLGYFPLFLSENIREFSSVDFTTFNTVNENGYDTFHILLYMRRALVIDIYEYVFDNEQNAFLVTHVYNASNIDNMSGPSGSFMIEGEAIQVEIPTERIVSASIIDIDGMHLFGSRRNVLHFEADSNARISLHFDIEQSNDTDTLFAKDITDWAMIMETNFGDYLLFPREYMQQLISIEYSTFNRENEDGYDIFHIFIFLRQLASVIVYEAVFDNEQNTFTIIPMYSAVNINSISNIRVS